MNENADKEQSGEDQGDEILEEFVNPMSQVYFRAGLLVMRELIAREMGRGTMVDSSVRKFWIHELCPDPGQPRRMDWAELTVEKGDGWDVNPNLTAETEALPVAFNYVESLEQLRGAGNEIKNPEG